MSTTSERRVAAEERVFSLILALVATPQGLRKQDLLSSVYGYSHEYQRGGDLSSLERKFERDKDQLRQLGIPLETIDAPLESGNNQLTRYRISKNQLEQSPDTQFTSQELMLLRAAALAWSESSLSAESRRAVMKLASHGASIDVSQLGIAPRISTTEPAMNPLREAIAQNVGVTFSYRRPDQQTPDPRTVAPLRLHRADGRWHLVAFDYDRDDYRVFLLSRIIGSVHTTKTATHHAQHEGVERVLAELTEIQDRQIAVIDVTKGSTAEARLFPRSLARSAQAESTAERIRLRIDTLDYMAFAEELLRYGNDVRVWGPTELIEHLHTLIGRMTELHREELNVIDSDQTERVQ